MIFYKLLWKIKISPPLSLHGIFAKNVFQKPTRPPSSLLSYVLGKTKSIEVDETLCTWDQTLELLRTNLVAVQTRMKQVYDKKHTDKELAVRRLCVSRVAKLQTKLSGMSYEPQIISSVFQSLLSTQEDWGSGISVGVVSRKQGASYVSYSTA